jgi:hypothetical protein
MGLFLTPHPTDLWFDGVKPAVGLHGLLVIGALRSHANTHDMAEVTLGIFEISRSSEVDAEPFFGLQSVGVIVSEMPPIGVENFVPEAEGLFQPTHSCELSRHVPFGPGRRSTIGAEHSNQLGELRLLASELPFGVLFPI